MAKTKKDAKPVEKAQKALKATKAPRAKKTAASDVAEEQPTVKKTLKRGTRFIRPEDAERNWWIIDAADQKVGRLATQIANILRGKNKPTYTPNVDNGDFVVVINTDKLAFSGNKWDQKKYYSHSRFFGSLKELTAAQQKVKDSTFIMSEAVRCMLPDNRLSYGLITKLKTYAGAEHPHAAQKPSVYTIKN